jgi:hypothetical protein
VRLDHPNLDDIYLGESLEHPPNGDKSVVATLFKEQFVTSIGGQVAIPGVHIARAPLDLQLRGNACHAQRVLDASSTRTQPQGPLHASVKSTTLSGFREAAKPALPTPHAGHFSSMAV